MLISVIIPVYNVASYLRQCLDSLLNQTNGHWEAICVDDGSTDGSGEILDDYAVRDRRFKVFHIKNGGVAKARNFGINYIAGDFFTFVDSDDVLQPFAFKMLENAVKFYPAIDGVITRPLCASFDNNVGRLQVVDSKGFDRIKDIGKVLTSPVDFLGKDHSVKGWMCGRFYRSNIYRHIKFPDGVSMAEDLQYWCNAMEIDAQWIELPIPFYGYRSRPGSAVQNRGKNIKWCLDEICSANFALNFARECGVKYKLDTAYLSDWYDYFIGSMLVPLKGAYYFWHKLSKREQELTSKIVSESLAYGVSDLLVKHPVCKAFQFAIRYRLPRIVFILIHVWDIVRGSGMKARWLQLVSLFK